MDGVGVFLEENERPIPGKKSAETVAAGSL
jgi:hypothetical protein